VGPVSGASGYDQDSRDGIDAQNAKGAKGLGVAQSGPEVRPAPRP